MSRETTHSIFEDGVLEQYYDAVTQVIHSKTTRYLNLSEIILIDPNTQKPITIRLTLVAEPVVFGDTRYPEGSEITTATCEQLKQMEKDNGVEI